MWRWIRQGPTHTRLWWTRFYANFEAKKEKKVREERAGETERRRRRTKQIESRSLVNYGDGLPEETADEKEKRIVSAK